MLLIRNVSGLVKMTFGLVHASYSLPEWQALNWLYLHPVLPTNIKEKYLNYTRLVIAELSPAKRAQRSTMGNKMWWTIPIRENLVTTWPLIWLAMVTNWGKNNPELYKLIWKNLVIVDEYPVENVHNVIRSKTNDHDSAEENIGDSKGYISEQTSSKQLSKILAAKNYSMFSQKHINNLKLRCAKLLAVCFPTWQNFPTMSDLLDQEKKCNSAKCLWQRTNNETCHEVFPLEYASQNQPNSNKRCEIPGFLVSSDKERRVFEGFTHSFHLECLGDMDICLFCQSFLQNKARSLTETAESAILHSRKQASAKQDKQPNDVVNDQSDDNEIEWQYCWNPKGEREIIFINERIKKAWYYSPERPLSSVPKRWPWWSGSTVS